MKYKYNIKIKVKANNIVSFHKAFAHNKNINI